MALQSYLDIFENISWTVGDTSLDDIFYNDNPSYEDISISSRPDILQQFSQPLPIGQIKIYYPDINDNYVPILYPSNMSILHILGAINTYFNTPITIEEANKLQQADPQFIQQILMGERGLGDRPTRKEILGSHVFFEGLIPYQDGYIISTGS